MRFVVLVCITLAYDSFFVSSASLSDVIGVGRSIAGIISTGINDFKSIHREFATEEEKPKLDDELTSDDIFSGLNDIWNKKNQPVDKIKNPEINPKSNNKQRTLNVSKVEDVDNETIGGDLNSESHWLRMRGIVANMRSIFMEMFVQDYEKYNQKGSMDVLKMLDRLMEIGDQINIVKKIENSFDEDLIDFLVEKWTNVKTTVVKASPSLENLLNVDSKILYLTIAKGLAKQFGHMFHKQALAHVNEQDFVISTMRTSGFKDIEILEVFNLLDLPTEELVSSSKSLLKNDVGSSRTYMSYEKKHIDPFTILAGLALAAFAAYIIYRLLSTTAAEKRQLNDINLISMSLSDMPDTVTKIYNWLEKAEKIYDGHDDDNELPLEESFSNTINGLWRSAKSSKSCVKQYICNHLASNGFLSMTTGMSIAELSMIVLANLVGVESGAKLYDRYVTELNKGEMFDCEKIAPQCVPITSKKKQKH